jgi:signal transduction histidine kinase
MVSVTITDDGSGGADATGAGVLGIRDRTRLLGGDVRLRDTAAGGTELTAFVPQSAQASQVVPQ